MNRILPLLIVLISATGMFALEPRTVVIHSTNSQLDSDMQPIVPTVRVLEDQRREAWARDLLGRLGNGNPSRDTVIMVIEWTLSEDRGWGAFERNNPLNTTQTGFNETRIINGDGVRGYETYEDGMNATLQTLSYGYYTDIVKALLANQADVARKALWDSPWEALHYGYGASWARLK